MASMGQSQVSNESLPISWNMPIPSGVTTWHTLGSIAPEGLLAEDALVAKSQPMRFAKNRLVNLSPANAGRWVNLANGDRIWKLGIECQNSFSVGLLFSVFSIPSGARMYIYSDNKNQHLGPFTDADNRQEDEILVTPPIYGSRLIIEYYEPFAYRGQGNFHIQSVQHGYRDLRQLSGGEVSPCIQLLEASSSTNSMSSSVLMMLVDGGQRIATGTMINNSAALNKPYLLTALQTMKGNPQGWVFLFDVTEQECVINGNCWSSAVCGATPVEVDSLHGTALISLRNAPPSSWSVYYSGWTTQINNNQSSYQSIQHAGGIVQSVALYNGTLQSIDWNGYEVVGVNNWNVGGTSNASIGSPLFDASHKVIGVYLGGDNDCDNNGMDYFALLSSSFTSFNSFLDPIKSGVNSLQGRYPPQLENVPTVDEFEVFIFPNPAKEFLNFQVLNDALLTEVQIMDASGRILYSDLPKGASLDIHLLPEGVYFLRFVAGEQSCIQKLLIR